MALRRLVVASVMAWAMAGLAPNTITSAEYQVAINARVKVTAGDLVQTREVLSGGSYISQNDVRLHFGLGAHDRADKIEITWPSGSVTALTNVAANQFVGIKEGEGIVSLEKVRPGRDATKK